MAAVTSEGAPGAHHQLAEWLRVAVLGPRGGGTNRRRASDAVRLGLAVVVVAVSIPVMKANSAVELSIVHAVHPPPAAISWLVTTVFWIGSAGVSVLLVIVGLLVPRLTAVRWTAVAAVLTWGVCILLGAVLGPAAGRPPLRDLSGVNTGYPVTQVPGPTKLRLRLNNVLARGAGWATQRGRGAPVWNNGDTAYPKSTPSMSAAGVMSGRRSMRNELPRPRREAMAGTSSAI